MLERDYLYKFLQSLVLTRFDNFKEFTERLDIFLSEFSLHVSSYDFKSDFDNDFEDYVLMVALANDKQDVIDLTLYYAITRIGQRVITEVVYEEI